MCVCEFAEVNEVYVTIRLDDFRRIGAVTSVPFVPTCGSVCVHVGFLRCVSTTARL